MSIQEPDHVFVRTNAIKIQQPLGVFYAVKLTAHELLEVAYAEPLKIMSTPELVGSYPLLGAQREESFKRRQEIGRYIETVEAAFPNAIILAANYREDGTFEEDEAIRWRIDDEHDTKKCLTLVIPSKRKVASIVDGQHRLFGFREASPSKSDMELLCAVYIDLPNPYQAYLFATINFNQKKVDRSLAYELFGFNLEDEPQKSWSPEKTAVSLTRKLNTDPTSPLYQRIVVAAQNDALLFNLKNPDIDWVVSTATIVDGFLKLFSSNPKADRDEMHRFPIDKGRHRSVLKDDRTPLRQLYQEVNDLAIFTAVKNFFIAMRDTLWVNIEEDSYIVKTVGIQASFEVLRLLLQQTFEQERDISVNFFRSYLEKASSVDFSESFFQASGIGKTRIRNTIAFLAGLIGEAQLSERDRKIYLKFKEAGNSYH